MLNIGRKLLARRRSDESGSIVMVVMIAFVVSVGLVAVLLQVNGALELTRTDQNRTNAFQFANAGVDQALYRIDSETMPAAAAGAYTPTVTAGEVTGFTDNLASGSSDFQVQASQSPAGQDRTWRVRSVGTDTSGRQRVAIATLEASPLFVNGFFTMVDFHLTGNQDSPVAYDSRTCPTASPSCQLPTPIDGSLGTNAEIVGSSATTASFVASWAGFNMYGRATQAAANQACDTGRCGTAPTVRAITNQYDPYDRMPTAPSAAQPCPNGGNLGTITLAPGDYVCDDLNITGTVTVAGTVGNVRIWADDSFNASSTAVVNRHQRTSRFQVYFGKPPPATAPSAGSSICGAEIWGVLYTPWLQIACSGSHQPKIFGAVIAQFHGGTGNHFDFHWDIATQSDVHDGHYVVRDWRECPVNVTDC